MADPDTDLTDNLTDDQKEKLLKILRKEEMAASNYQDATLMGHRSDSLDYYDREPYPEDGGLGDGQSQIVTSEFADTIESIMPSMMRVFAGSESSVEFSPTGPGQEQAVEEASDYVPHVLMVKNDGYRILNWFIKDSMMYRLGGVTVDVEEIEETKDFPINNLPADALNVLIQKAEQSGATLVMDDMEQDPAPPPAPPQIDPQTGQPIPQEEPPPTFSGTITATQKRKIVTVDNIASEDILFTPTARDQDKASYLGFRKKVSASELVDLGLPWEDVELLKSDRPISPEETQRNASGIISEPVRNEMDDSERVLWVIVAYVRWAPKDDGKSKMYRTVYAHARGEISSLIEAQEWEGPASMSLATPILMSNTIIGRDIFDQVKDLQEIGSVLTRGLLNNLYAVNTPRPIVDDQVNLDSLIDWVPGSPIRLKAGAKAGDNHVSFLQVPSVLQNAQAALEYFQTVRENRTGVVRNTQGIEGKTLQNDTLGGMSMMMNAAQQRIELIARTLAETAIKRLYRLIYRAIKRAATGQAQYWSGQAMKTVDPTKWPDDLDLTVNVGAGTRDQALQGLAMVASAQEKLITLQGGQANGPFVTAENVANLTQKTVESIGYKTPGMFFQPPEKVVEAVQNAPPKPPTPEMQIAQLKVQGETAKAQSDQQVAQINAQAAAAKAQGDQGKAVIDAQAKQATIQLQAQKQQQDHDRALQELAIKARANDQLHERETAKMALDNHNQQADRAHKEGIEVLGVVAGHHQAEQNNAAKSDIADKAASTKEMGAPAKGGTKGPAQGFLDAIKDQSKVHSDTAEKHAKGVEALGKHIGDGMKALAETQGKLADALLSENEVVRGVDGKVTGTRRKKASK